MHLSLSEGSRIIVLMGGYLGGEGMPLLKGIIAFYSFQLRPNYKIDTLTFFFDKDTLTLNIIKS